MQTKVRIMKIAIPLTEEKKISDHFGQSDCFGVYTISDNREITSVSTVAVPEGRGCRSDIAGTLADEGVTVMLASGMGNGAFRKFTNSGISVMRGWSGSVQEIINDFLCGKITDLGSSCFRHVSSSVHLSHEFHDHGHEHDHDSSHAHACGCSTEGHSCGCS
jgi:predicted Fe-Mo cluster-binding NifX family protein